MLDYIRMKMIKDKRTPEEILEDGLNCQAEVTVGEVVDIIATMAEHVKKSAAYQKLIEEIGPECEAEVENFVISFVCSEISTLTGQFRMREQPKIEA